MEKIRQKSSNIYLLKGSHKGKDVIWLQFSHRSDWLAQVKQLSDIAYSRSNKMWYLPYSVAAFQSFKQLKIPYTHSGTHAGDIKSPDGEPAPGHDHTGISTLERRKPASPSTGIEVADIQPAIKVDWSGKGFIIHMPNCRYTLGPQSDHDQGRKRRKRPDGQSKCTFKRSVGHVF